MKKFVALLVLGVIFLIVPFCFSSYSLIRLLTLALGIFLITLSLVFLKKKNILLIILMPIILICLSYAVDTFFFYQFNRIPLFVYEITSSDKVSTYNSFFYRIFNCDGALVLDYGYNKNYVCSEDDLANNDINDLLSDINRTYENYKDKFIKISGKISKITGTESIELSSYSTSNDSLNGYVNFNNNYVIRIHVNESLNAYRVYDNIVAIGKVDSLTHENGVAIINLVDSLLIPSDIYDIYTYEIVNSDDDNLISLVSEQNYYLYGISVLNVRYANNDIYELSYLITDARMTIDDIIENISATNLYDEEEVLVAKSYELEKFNALVCENDKKIFANKKMDLNIELCLN